MIDDADLFLHPEPAADVTIIIVAMKILLLRMVTETIASKVAEIIDVVVR